MPPHHSAFLSNLETASPSPRCGHRSEHPTDARPQEVVQACAAGAASGGAAAALSAAKESAAEIPDGYSTGHSQGPEVADAKERRDPAQRDGRNMERAHDARVGGRFSSSAADRHAAPCRWPPATCGRTRA